MWGVPPFATLFGVLGFSPSLLREASGLSPLPPFASRAVGMCEAFFAGLCVTDHAAVVTVSKVRPISIGLSTACDSFLHGSRTRVAVLILFKRTSRGTPNARNLGLWPPPALWEAAGRRLCEAERGPVLPNN